MKTKADLMKLVGDIDYTAPFSVGVYPDNADPTGTRCGWGSRASACRIATTT